nr:immunoglobulin light chain junction region [Macaca mulatta]MPN80569.1 immunoglobulin light chain junction region [Macaca mulatta]MPN80634.1 immunoglobulin light chain junction region [Macaca mulatta]
CGAWENSLSAHWVF